ncbi:capsule biosynthesis protein [Leptospira fletcheri]|uniref:Capsule biosynthesis protein n=1 Tax=Leptospira fletcheri TaxID=2484981 RepID=A0A4R9GF91_9LEPT|nr:capsule biosynthesis protein [Leptospira fletcheri]TGK09950.1 capsule biosynthesis protein [Leptospira fletcheri]
MKILFFSPHAAIWVHSFPEALIAEALQNYGHEIVYVGCNSSYSEYCTVMSALGLTQDSIASLKSAACKNCSSHRALLRHRFNFREIEIGDKLTDRERSFVKETSNKPITFLKNYSVDNVPLGKNSLYELLLQLKKSDLELSTEEEEFYRIAFRNALLTHLAAKRIIDEEKPECLFVYNSLYVVNHSFAMVAQGKGIPFYFLHAGENIASRLSSMIVYKGYTFEYRKDLIKYWPIFREIPLDLQAIRNVGKHFRELFKGSHFLVYSSKLKGTLSIRESLGIPKESRLVVATLSSNDERYASACAGVSIEDTKKVFSNQIEWIEATINYFKTRKDLYLLIRVHPREFPNKRDSVKSTHAKELEKVLQDLPHNVIINWPEDGLSLYDLSKETDLFLNAWSSVGEEMTLLGIPVLIYSNDLILYPADLNLTCNDKESYFRQLERALNEGFDFNRIIHAFRWYAMKFSAGTFQVSTFLHSGEARNALSHRLKLLQSKLQTIWLLFSSKFSASSRQKLCLKRSLPLEFREMNYERNIVDKSLLSRVIVGSLNSKLDLMLPSKSKVSQGKELQFVKREMKGLVKVLFSNELEKGSASTETLYANLQTWISSAN